MVPPRERKEELEGLFDVDEILATVIPIYGKHFSEEELKELIKFYESSTVRKYMRLTPTINREIMVMTVNYFKEKVNE